jgi:hypothetical protein
VRAAKTLAQRINQVDDVVRFFLRRGRIGLLACSFGLYCAQNRLSTYSTR